MLKASPPIQYTPSLEKTIHWGKDWIKYYAPTTKNIDLDDVFDDAKFVKKYSSKPPANMSSKDILKDAKIDIDAYTTKVTKRINALQLDDESKVIKKVMAELPSAEILTQILLSYRIYNTVGKQRIRIPTNLVINVNNIEVKRQQKTKSNNKNN
ncbi:hypothetical protein BST79_gp069 [Only Syngen Nebraska virus 5]|uniref:hypothetical protein n=1 Tax=Only Syngen Nebraska virus 5 TaxID=1917232 RepID=UPI000901DB0A|nr:hypothetical protein BST79_gp069 [Only Syngen Nebraska virus 5]APC25582.1 hypothetical protein [Only Syngen Nebraska virus 5]